ncbi:MAG: glycosyltransferase [Candidatus Electryonea clarkiae]|nr:glycosyltransferase [Candidatus Electryonea clarkiae]MDP8288804.1 glycosyltransferase [Candidatus Electryonea clarkiae]
MKTKEYSAPLFNATVVYIHSDTPAYVKVRNTLPLLAKLFKEVHYIGCTRHHAWNEFEPENINCHIADLQLGNGVKTIAGLFKFYGYIRSKLKEIKPDIVIAVNEEYILPFRTGYFPRPRRLILDLYDSIAMRIIGPARHFNPIWRLISQWAIGSVDALVEVIENRLEWHKTVPPVTAIVYNAPNYIDNIKPKEGLPDNFIYVCGTIKDKIHGIETLLEAVERVEDMKVVFSGRPVGDFVRNTFLKNSNVVNLGMVEASDVVKILAASKAIYAHVSPVLLNYVYGAPNKLYEAMMVGKPVLLNSENHASKMPEEIGFGLVSPYGDVKALTEDVHALLDENPVRDAACQKARKLFKEKYALDNMENVWKGVFKQLKVPRIQV